MKRLLSETAVSNIFTMGCAAAKDPRQKIPDTPTMPSEETRILRARLVTEEALETCRALGVTVENKNDMSVDEVVMSDLVFRADLDPDMESIIDGCCDVIYVAVGTLCSLGVPDLPHMRAVNFANDAKFPHGEAITNENGKFLKPDGWKPPVHLSLLIERLDIKTLVNGFPTAIPKDALCFFQDGGSWCCVWGDFNGLAESNAGFGDCMNESLEALRKIEPRSFEFVELVNDVHHLSAKVEPVDMGTLPDLQ